MDTLHNPTVKAVPDGTIANPFVLTTQTAPTDGLYHEVENQPLRLPTDVVYIGVRGDGRVGSGASPADSIDVPDAATYDALIRSRAAIPTKWVYTSDVSSGGSQDADPNAFSNHWHDGQGHTLTLVGTPAVRVAFRNPSAEASILDDFRVTRMKIDCDHASNPAGRSAALNVSGCDLCLFEDVEVVNAGAATVGELFVIAMQTVPNPTWCHIRHCKVHQMDHNGRVDGMTAILLLRGYQLGTSSTEQYNRANVSVYGCVVHGLFHPSGSGVLYSNGITSPLTDSCDFYDMVAGAYVEPKGNPGTIASEFRGMTVRNCTFRRFQVAVYCLYAGTVSNLKFTLDCYGNTFYTDEAPSAAGGLRVIDMIPPPAQPALRTQAAIIRNNRIGRSDGVQGAGVGQYAVMIRLVNVNQASIMDNVINQFTAAVPVINSIDAATVTNLYKHNNRSIGGGVDF